MTTAERLIKLETEMKQVKYLMGFNTLIFAITVMKLFWGA